MAPVLQDENIESVKSTIESPLYTAYYMYA